MTEVLEVPQAETIPPIEAVQEDEMAKKPKAEETKIYNFTVSRKEFLKEIEIVSKAVEKNTTIPILSNVMLQVKGKRLVITGTDLELGIVAGCEVHAITPGKWDGITLPAKQILGTLKSMSGDEVVVTHGLSGPHNTHMQSGLANMVISGMGTDGFPELPVPPKEGQITAMAAGTLLDAIERTKYAISKEISRFTLNGALLDIKGGKAEMVATDGHRLAYREFQCDGEFKALIPNKTLAQIAALADAILKKAKGKPGITLSRDENHMYVKIGDRLIISRVLTGNFPDHKRVMRGASNDLIRHAAIVEVAAFKAALGRASKYADVRSCAVRLGFSAEGLKVFASTTDTGEYAETVPAIYTMVPQRKCLTCKKLTTDMEVTACPQEVLESGTEAPCDGILEEVEPGMEVGYNWRYLMDILNSTKEDKVGFMLIDCKSPAELRPVGTPGVRCVVMPMRL